MKAWDVLHHATLVNNNLTLKTIQMCILGFSAQSLQVRVLERPKVKHSIKAKEAYERNPSAPTLSGWINRTDWVKYCEGQNNMTFREYVPC